MSVLSRIDNQIVTLAARSPDNAISGCTIERKKLQPSTSTTEAPMELNTQGENDSFLGSTKTIFDKYLKRPTNSPSESSRDIKPVEQSTENVTNKEGSADENMEAFNDTEVFNSTSKHGRNGGGLFFKHDQGFENELENTTEYKLLVEELFEPPKKSEPFDDDTNTSRPRRSYPFHLSRPRESFIVKCHNAGSFISSRERWWFIAISNCNNDKGLDIKYKFKMTNGNTGDFWHEHFSADERRK